MNKLVKIALAVGGALIIFAGIAIVGVNSQNNNARTSDGSTANPAASLPAPKDDAGLTIITYTDEGFVPDSYTIKPNSNVRIRNNSVSIMQFMSDPFRTNIDNPELNVGRFNPGDTRTFYVSQQGKWGFHNELDPSKSGTLYVLP